jgi:SET domain-containing protein
MHLSLIPVGTRDSAVPPHAPPLVPWVDEVVIVNYSVIQGRGLFTNADLDAGRVVIRLGGRLVSSSELDQLFDAAPPYVDTVAVYEDIHLVLPSGTTVHYCNHSCDPNLWHVGPYEIATRRSVAAGEELTVDYGTHSAGEGFSMACACGASTCRGTVTSEDWRRPELQAKYNGHWAPVLEERIRRL